MFRTWISGKTINFGAMNSRNNNGGTEVSNSITLRFFPEKEIYAVEYTYSSVTAAVPVSCVREGRCFLLSDMIIV